MFDNFIRFHNDRNTSQVTGINGCNFQSDFFVIKFTTFLKIYMVQNVLV